MARLVFLLVIGLLFHAPQGVADEVPKVVRLEDKLEVGDLLVIGEAEMFSLPELDSVWPARIDSGATTTSLHAVDIEEFERDGKPWVRFVARNEELDKSIEMERPVVRVAFITRRGGEPDQRRPVVEMALQVGPLVQTVEVNLTDRTDFTFPLLIGRNFLSGVTLIDVSRAYLHGTKEEMER
ncbi:hypothetical protein BXY66_0808 [Shimia isoporae]|uniref:Retropepsin-like aspartic endopeptidase domain-containing protein n=1 Tax=Shimia isoporae TaxID=647720 RepID=A0A4V2Q3W4_9RHOB|nr:RimK/LysX family protein [Shimia isoporae]TCL08770.1 hypothetical protein BXY66_0808 [Shimia isoporae]